MLKVVTGDWSENKNVVLKRSVFGGKAQSLRFQKWLFFADTYSLTDIQSAQLITADNGASVAGKLGWAAAGAVTLGPIGAIVGSIAGGNKNSRIVAIVFKDGKKVILKGKAKEVEPLLAAGFNWAA